MSNYKAHIQMHFIVLIWGFTGILGKLISISAIPLVGYRMFIALAGMAVFFLFSRYRLEIHLRKIIQLLATGILICLHWILFFEALKVSNVSVTLACISSASLFTAILEPVFFNRRIIWYEVIFGLVVMIGLFTIFRFETQYVLGIFYSLLAAFLAALFTVINGRFIRHTSAKTISFYEMAGGCIGVGIYLLVSHQPLTIPGLSDWIYLLILGLICTGFAFIVSVEVMKHLSPYSVSVSVNLEPIYAIILALLFFKEDERMTAGFYLGAMIILLTVFSNTLLKNKQTRKN